MKKTPILLAIAGSLLAFAPASAAQFVQFEIVTHGQYHDISDFRHQVILDKTMTLIYNIDTALNPPGSSIDDARGYAFYDQDSFFLAKDYGPYEYRVDGGFAAVDYASPAFDVTSSFNGTSTDGYTYSHYMTPRQYTLGGVSVAIRGANTPFLIPSSVTYATSVVGPAPQLPEPATWAMLLLGFGLIGTAVRQRTRHEAALRYG